MKFRINCSKDYAGLLINTIDQNRNDLPKKLKWIEPSINNLYLEACSSFLFGNYYACIICTGMLLEHTLRLAIIDDKKCGLNREVSIGRIDRFNSLSKLIIEAERKSIILSDDVEWWNDIAKVFRNKSAHYLLPVILKECFENKKYYNFQRKSMKDVYKDEYYKKYLLDWGNFYDKESRKIAKEFLNETFVQLSKIIEVTNWDGDESWWESQKTWYDHFFDDNWESECVIEQMYNAYKPHKNIKLEKNSKHE